MYNKKTPVKILDRDLNYVAEIDDYKSLIFKRCYNNYSTFSISIALDKQNTEHLKAKNFIILDLNSDKTGIILNRKIKLDEKNQEILTVKGFTLNCLLTKRRVLEGFKLSNAKIDNLVYKLLNENIINSSNIKRNINNLIINKIDHDFKSINYEVKSNEKILNSEISDICKNNNLGYKIGIDYINKKFVFTLYEGKDLTNDRVTFSPRLGNVKEQEYEYSEIEEKNVCFVKYKDNIKEFGEFAGIDRNETFIEYKTSNDDIIKTIEDIANEEFDKNSIVDSLTCAIIPDKVFIYERDYNLGDKVIIENSKWDIKKDLRIIEIEEIYEQEGKINITFGEPSPTLATKIKGKLNDIESKKLDNEIIRSLEKRIIELEDLVKAKPTTP